MAQSKEQKAAKQRAYYARTRERWAELARQQRAVDPEKYRKRGRDRYAANTEQILAANKRRYAANPQAHVEYARKARAADPTKFRRRRRLVTYGLKLADFLELWNLQAGRCDICTERLVDDGSRQTHVDHCRRTGAVRGLLCADCNVGLGRFKDDPKALLAAAHYVSRGAYSSGEG